MESSNSWVLPVLIFWPVAAVILALLVKNEKAIKWGSILASTLPLGSEHLYALCLQL